MQRELLAEISQAAGIKLQVSDLRSVSGGDISQAFRVCDVSGHAWFLKTNSAVFMDAFAAEQQGLVEIAQSKTLRVPEPVACGIASNTAWLLMEWLEFSPGQNSDAELGQKLACMHQVTGKSFGWWRDNFIGSAPQLNAYCDDWISFYQQQRLQPQLDRLRDRGVSQQLIKHGLQLLDHVPEFFTDRLPVPALLHGDLWAGNRAMLADGTPVVFDPAVYFGDPETDLAMTRLFGGYSADFYTAYDKILPPAPGAEQRCTLYQLYHVLNHCNLFGGAYLLQADRMLRKLLVANQ